MNIQRFILPATIAAAFHAVMLVPGKVTAITTDHDTPQTSEPAQPPEKDLMEIPLVSESKEVTEEKVTPLANKGADLPVIEEILTNPANSDFKVPMEFHKPTKLPVDTKIIGPLGDPLGMLGGNRPKGEFVLPASLLDKAPNATVRMAPDYPGALRNEGIEGVVTVEFVVDTKGRVVSAAVRKSTHHAFDEPTLRAVLKWRFEPGLSQGSPVPFRLMIPVTFKLGENRG